MTFIYEVLHIVSSNTPALHDNRHMHSLYYWRASNDLHAMPTRLIYNRETVRSPRSLFDITTASFTRSTHALARRSERCDGGAFVYQGKAWLLKLGGGLDISQNAWGLGTVDIPSQ
jgi:hypothetical protein